MSALALPCKCTLCGTVIGNYALEWPPPKDNAAMQAANESQFGKMLRAMPEHLKQGAETEARLQDHAHDGRHGRALALAISTGGNMSTYMVASRFDLPPAASGFFESFRLAGLEILRGFRMTDEDIEALAEATAERLKAPVHPPGQGQSYGVIISRKVIIGDLLRSVRDRYQCETREAIFTAHPKTSV